MTTGLKLLHVITGLGLGGAETALFRLISHDTCSGIRHHVVSLGAGNVMRDRYVRHTASLRELNWRPGLKLPAEIWRLRAHARFLNPDLVVGWMYHGNIAGQTAAAACGRPQLWNIRHALHETAQEAWMTRMVIQYGRRISHRPVAIVYNSRASARLHEAFGYDAARTCVIANGIDTAQFDANAEKRNRIRQEFGIQEGQVLVVHVARYHPDKGHDVLLRALPNVVARHEKTRVLMIGTDITKTNSILTRSIETLDLTEQVILGGPRDDVDAIYAAADIAVNPSLTESFPNSLAEAMASRLFCVATDVGDVRDIVGANGLLVPAGDADQLSKALCEAVALGPELRDRIGRDGRRHISRNFSIQKMCEEFHQTFRRAVSGAEKCAE